MDGNTEPRKGKIIWAKAKKGYGFIRDFIAGDEVFFHRTSMEDTDFDCLKEGDLVQFKKERKIDGRATALNVKRIKNASWERETKDKNPQKTHSNPKNGWSWLDNIDAPQWTDLRQENPEDQDSKIFTDRPKTMKARKSARGLNSSSEASLTMRENPKDISIGKYFSPTKTMTESMLLANSSFVDSLKSTKGDQMENEDQFFEESAGPCEKQSSFKPQGDSLNESQNRSEQSNLEAQEQRKTNALDSRVAASPVKGRPSTADTNVSAVKKLHFSTPDKKPLKVKKTSTIRFCGSNGSEKNIRFFRPNYKKILWKKHPFRGFRSTKKIGSDIPLDPQNLD